MSQVAYFRQQYARMGDEELAILLESVDRNPESLVDAAKEALVQEIGKRNISISKLLAEKAAYEHADREQMSEQNEKSESKRKLRTKYLERFMGATGIGASIVIFIPSFSQAHLVGILTAVATLACSIWLLFKRDKE